MTGQTDLLGALRTAVQHRVPPDPAVRASLVESGDAPTMRRAGRLLADLRPGGTELRPVRVDVLATCTIGSYVDLLRAGLVGAGLLPVIEEGPYGRFEMSLAAGSFAGPHDPQDGQGEGPDEADVVSLLLDESYFLPDDWDPTEMSELDGHVQARLADLRAHVLNSAERSGATLVLHTVPLPAQVRDSVISVRGRAALSRAWARLNAGICELAEHSGQVAVVDLVSVLADTAVSARDDRLHRFGDLPYTDGALLALAHEVRRFVQAKRGLSRKVLALDLDNTLWGGVIGDVGAGGVTLGGLYPGNCYLELQRTAARLRGQGVVLVLTSKNDADLVDSALAEHPEMLLRSEAFSVTAVNWSPKAGNLRAAAESLGLSTGSFVLVDDSPFERGQVASELPEVAMVPAEGDPAHLVRSLLRHGWFDVVELTGTDQKRPELYRTRARRHDFSGGFSSSEDYLRALDIRLTVDPVSDYTVGRAAQLAARTNQFNLTGVRPDEAATAAMGKDPDHLVTVFSVRDRFGDEGIVGASWVDRSGGTWRVSNLVLSCRVLGRGVELAIADWLAGQARRAGADRLEGRFVESGRNGVASDFWKRAGFAPGGDGVFALDLRESGSGPESGSGSEPGSGPESGSGPGRTPGWITVVNGSEDSR